MSDLNGGIWRSAFQHKVPKVKDQSVLLKSLGQSSALARSRCRAIQLTRPRNDFSMKLLNNLAKGEDNSTLQPFGLLDAELSSFFVVVMILLKHHSEWELLTGHRMLSHSLFEAGIPQYSRWIFCCFAVVLLLFCGRPCWSVGISWSSWDWRLFSNGGATPVLDTPWTVSQGKILRNTPPWSGIKPGPEEGQTVRYPTELSWLVGSDCYYGLNKRRAHTKNV